MSAEQKELCAGLIRKYGRDAEGVERAMIEADYGEITAAASAHMWADTLERWGYDVGGDAFDEPCAEELAEALEPVDDTPEPVEDDPGDTVSELIDKGWKVAARLSLKDCPSVIYNEEDDSVTVIEDYYTDGVSDGPPSADEPEDDEPAWHCEDDMTADEVEALDEPDFDPADYDTKGAACAAFAALNPDASTSEVADACECSYATARKHKRGTES